MQRRRKSYASKQAALSMRWSTLLLVCAIGLILPAAQVAAQAVFYVDKANAGGTENGASWATAYSKIQDAIDAATAVGTAVQPAQVWVAQGTYNEARTQSWGDVSVQGALILKSYVSLYGGFLGNETALSQRIVKLYPTIIDGDANGLGTKAIHTVVVGSEFAPSENVRIDGFTITNGDAAGNGGSGSADWHTYRGGGLYNWLSDPVIANCTFVANRASFAGGAIDNASDGTFTPRPLIINCEFRSNVAANESTWDGGFFPGLRGGGAVSNAGAEPTFIHCTFNANSATNSNGAAIFDTRSSDSSVINSIVWGNTNPAPDQLDEEGAFNMVVTYSDVESPNLSGSNGNDNSNPLFVSVSNLDLQSGSPCIDQADNTYSAAVENRDIRGVTRPFQITTLNPDMGAYEYDNSNPAMVCQNITRFLENTGDPITITTADVDNGGSDAGGLAETLATLDQYTFGTADLGDNTVTLTFFDYAGNSNTCTATVRIEQKPTATFDSTPAPSGAPPLYVDPTDVIGFDASASSGGSGTIIDYSWDFDYFTGDSDDDGGDNATTTSTFSGRSTAYAISVLVTAQYPGGETETDRFTRTGYIVSQKLWEPAFDTNPFGPLTGLDKLKAGDTGVVVNFLDLSSPGTDSSPVYSWDFDYDGVTMVEDSSVTGNTSHTYTNAGIYSIRLEITSSLISPATPQTLGAEEVAYVEVDRLPSADFVATSATTGDTPFTVSFDASSSTSGEFADGTSGVISNYAWNFGDGQSANTASATIDHEYTVAGIYTVSLTVTSDVGDSNPPKTLTNLVDVQTKPAVVFSGDQLVGLPGLTVNFDSTGSDGGTTSDGVSHSIGNYQWDFDNNVNPGWDAAGVSENAPSYTYNLAGDYDVTLRVSSTDAGLGYSEETITGYIQVKNLPVVTLTVNPVTDAGSPGISGENPFQAEFYAEATEAADIFVVNSWAWDFGNGETATGAGDVGTPHTANYTEGNSYTVTVTATTDFGDVTDTVVVAVAQEPDADFVPNPAFGNTDGSTTLSVAFDSSTTVPGKDPSNTDVAISYAWDFDYTGGTPDVDSTDANPTHIYIAAGTYTARLDVTTVYGTSFHEETIEVSVAPTASFTASVTEGVTNLATQLAVDFDAAATDGGLDYNAQPVTAITYSWDFDGDGSEDSTEVAPSYIYITPGTYNATLTVTTAYGTDTEITVITVKTLPTADFVGLPLRSYENQAVQFTSSGLTDPGDNGTGPASAAITGYTWDFGDGSADSVADPSYAYTAAGIYDVGLVVTSEVGASAQELKSAYVEVVQAVTVDEQPQSYPSVDPGVPNSGATISFDVLVSGGYTDVSGDLQYQWQYSPDDGFGSPTGAWTDLADHSTTTPVQGDTITTIWSGTMTDTLTIQGVLNTEIGHYRCVIVDDDYNEVSGLYPGGTATSASASLLALNSNLQVTLQPIGGNRYVGDTFSMTVDAIGGYECYTDPPVPLTTKDYVFTWLRDSGSYFDNNQTTTIIGLVAGDADYYHCTVSVDCNDGSYSQSVNSAYVQLVVAEAVAAPAPVITSPVGIDPNVGETVVLTATPTDGYAPYTFEWEFRASSLDPWVSVGDLGGRATKDVALDGSSGALTIVNLALSETGEYRYIAFDSNYDEGDPSSNLDKDWEVSSEVSLNITNLMAFLEGPPSGHPQDTIIYDGDTATFTTTIAGGVADYVYTWQFNDAGTWTTVETHSGVTLQEDSLILAGAAAVPGEYRVFVDDADTLNNPTITSNAATLTVVDALDAQATISVPANGKAYEGGDITFSVIPVGGIGELTYAWEINDVANPTGDPAGAWAPLGSKFTVGDITQADVLLNAVHMMYDGRWLRCYVQAEVSDDPSSPVENTQAYSTPLQLKVSSPMTYILQPEDSARYLEAPGNEPFTMTATVEGGQTETNFGYVWYRRAEGDASATVVESGPMVGTNTASLLIDPAVVNVGEWDYFVEISDDVANNASDEASVEVDNHLAFDPALPATQEATNNSDYDLLATATGGLGTVTVTWTKQNPDTMVYETIQEGGDSFSFVPATYEDAGNYMVEAVDEGAMGYEVSESDTVATMGALTVKAGVPVTGVLGMSILTAVSALGGALGLRRRRK